MSVWDSELVVLRGTDTVRNNDLEPSDRAARGRAKQRSHAALATARAAIRKRPAASISSSAVPTVPTSLDAAITAHDYVSTRGFFPLASYVKQLIFKCGSEDVGQIQTAESTGVICKLWSFTCLQDTKLVQSETQPASQDAHMSK